MVDSQLMQYPALLFVPVADGAVYSLTINDALAVIFSDSKVKTASLPLFSEAVFGE